MKHVRVGHFCIDDLTFLRVPAALGRVVPSPSPMEASSDIFWAERTWTEEVRLFFLLKRLPFSPQWWMGKRSRWPLICFTETAFPRWAIPVDENRDETHRVNLIGSFGVHGQLQLDSPERFLSGPVLLQLAWCLWASRTFPRSPWS